MLDELFMSILDLTKTGSIVILAVIAVRFLLKKAPKVISYALWAVVLFRLLCPVTLELPVSLIPQIIPVKETYSLADEQVSFTNVGTAAYKAVGDVMAGHGSDGTLQIPVRELYENGDYIQYDVAVEWTDVGVFFGQYVWLLGVAAMVVYSIVSYARLRRRMAVKIPLGDGVYLADEIGFPFVIGILKPKIYLPSGMDAQERIYVLNHERHHIRRLDPLWKALGFLALVLHWFNPLVWVAFILAGKDMEMSCDEAVIGRMGEEVCADYAQSLASLATDRRSFTGMPLAFAEGDPKMRIRNLSKWKKPATWTVALAVCVSMLLGICLIADPVQAKSPSSCPVEYDPDRQIYITGENIYVDYYIGVTNLPNITVEVYSKKYIDPEDISVAFPVELPFVVHISQTPVQRKTDAMVAKENSIYTMPYYVYYASRGGDMAELDTNEAIKAEYRALKAEDVPEFYVYDICVAFIDIWELDAPVTLEKIDITIGEEVYETKLGRVRLLPKEAFPSDTQMIFGGGGKIGNNVKPYNGGILWIHDSKENVREDVTLTGLWMLDEETEILDITVAVSSIDGGMEKEWDGKTPIHVKKGDTFYINVMVRDARTEKFLNRVHQQSVLEFTRDATGEKMCCVFTELEFLERNPHEYYAMIFEGVDMEPYYREYFYKRNFRWVEEYRYK